MKISFDIADYIEKIKKNKSYFQTFINTTSLAAGVLVLKPGEKDTQVPHESDEVYLILRGDGFLKVKDKSFKISENKLYHVKKNVDHFFYGNTKELVVLYFFGGPDS